MRHDWVRAPAVSIPRPTGGVYLVEVIGAGELEVRGAVGLGFSAANAKLSHARGPNRGRGRGGYMSSARTAPRDATRVETSRESKCQ